MEATTAKKRARVDEVEDPGDYDDYPPRKHIGVCTAFCRKCAEIGHSWRRCRLFLPHHIWVNQRYGMRTTIQNVNITLPVVNPGPVMTSTSLKAAILSQLEVALTGLHRKAGIPMDSRITMNNVNVTTNILASERAGPIAPDTPLLDRVQRTPTGPRSNIPSYRPTPMKPTFSKSAFARSSFSQPISSQPVFGQTAFSRPTFVQNNSVGITPTRPRHGGF
ncbi:hypothetical protein N7491_009863 [Penicillium cf. griseofulvum]|uniref:Uncharacterized protein n=1 Tax=Penicillium cf. griseofulvum TaxID=2972120 RepID=A0A9W9T5I8_9EURO|nr:hypothetical protein N7472_000190 [Penicillium cf. griseofulvum]KAJ5421418.1 hypothetical protein N7491_009863 [Penicillium cf. griseofulvum]